MVRAALWYGLLLSWPYRPTGGDHQVHQGFTGHDDHASNANRRPATGPGCGCARGPPPWPRHARIVPCPWTN